MHEVSTPNVPQQDGLAERSNRTIIEGARTLLMIVAHQRCGLWSEAANTVVYTTNRTLSPKDATKTKFELFTGCKPSVAHLRIFCQPVVAQIPRAKRSGKWNPIGKVFRFVGYTRRSNTYRLFDPE